MAGPASELASVVHEHEAGTCCGARGRQVGIRERADVVDEGGAGGQRRGGDGRPSGLHGDHRSGPSQSLNQRQQTPDLFVPGHLLPGPGLDRADIDQVGPRSHHGGAVGHRGVEIHATPVEERIGGPVEDPHDEAARGVEFAGGVAELHPGRRRERVVTK
jgi:hypothetical protein